MSLETIIGRASAMGYALGKRSACIAILEKLADRAITATNPFESRELAAAIDIVRAADDAARAEYEAAKAVGDA